MSRVGIVEPWLLLIYTYLDCLFYLVSMLVLKSLDENLSEICFLVPEAQSPSEYLELLSKYWPRSLSPLHRHKARTIPLISKNLLQVHTSMHSSECQSSAGMNSVQCR